MNEQVYLQTLSTVIATQNALASVLTGPRSNGPTAYYVMAVMNTGLQFMARMEPPESLAGLHAQFLEFEQVSLLSMAKELDGEIDPDLKSDLEAKTEAFMQALQEATGQSATTE